MAIRIINAQQVRDLLPMNECIDCVEAAMLASADGSLVFPARQFMPLADDSGSFGLMPGTSKALGVYGAKLISLHPGNPAQGLPAIQGFITLFDHNSGSPIALIEGSEVTATRTAAASGLAAKYLARQDASSVGILGTGVQAISHIDAMRSVRAISEVLIWGRSYEKASALAIAEVERTGLAVRAVRDAKEAAACDLVNAVTAASEPVLFGDWLKPGCHVNLVGVHSPTAREADAGLIKRSRLYVDWLESAMNEAGDILLAIEEGSIAEDHILGDIAGVISGAVAGRSDASDITCYKSLGITSQDLFAAAHVFEKAVAADIGTVVEL